MNQSLAFYLTPEQANIVQNGRKVETNGMVVYKMHVLLRFTKTTSDGVQDDDFPKNVVLKVNNKVSHGNHVVLLLKWNWCWGPPLLISFQIMFLVKYFRGTPMDTYLFLTSWICLSMTCDNWLMLGWGRSPDTGTSTHRSLLNLSSLSVRASDGVNSDICSFSGVISSTSSTVVVVVEVVVGLVVVVVVAVVRRVVVVLAVDGWNSTGVRISGMMEGERGSGLCDVVLYG